MMRCRYSILTSWFLLLFFNNLSAQSTDGQLVQQSIKTLTDVMVFDITSPPVASRNYAYAIIAFYEAARPGNNTYKSFTGILRDFDSIPVASKNEQYDWLVAGTSAFYKTSKSFVFSKDVFQQSWNKVESELRKRPIPPSVYQRSVKYGEQVAEEILKWAKKDNYAQMRSIHRFTASKDQGNWQQTPPDFVEAVEPNWNQLRPMTLATPSEFSIPDPPVYKTVEFLNECKRVFDVNKGLTKEQANIANYWDCNPFATETVGHLMYSVKKMSPGGHWIGITGIAIRQKKFSLVEALHTYSLVSIGLYDAFIATWNIKYKTNYIRPITAIQQLISPIWQPILQTPPFPEYPSGHSVVSMASAFILTKIFGDNFSFVDDSEKEFGLPNRSFKSFYEAANEAAISRLYGGIHFMPAITNGKELGQKVGNYVFDKVCK